MVKIPNVYDNEAFSAIELTQQINEIAFQGTQLRDLLPVSVTNATTSDIAIEKSANGIAVIDAAPRGSAGAEIGLAKKSSFKLTVPHYPVSPSINANEMREALQSVGQAGELVGIRALHERYMTNWAQVSFPQLWERGLGGALDGIIRSSSGVEEISLRDLYGDAPQEIEVDYTDADFDWITTLEEAKAAARKRLGGFAAVRDWTLLMFGEAAKSVRSNKKLAATKERIDPAFLSADRIKNSSRTRFSDDVELFTYQSTPGFADPVVFDDVDAGGCMLVPIVPGLIDCTFTPTETIDGVNGPGLPLYADVPEEYATKRGYKLTAESNFLFTVKRLGALMKFVQA